MGFAQRKHHQGFCIPNSSLKPFRFIWCISDIEMMSTPTSCLHLSVGNKTPMVNIYFILYIPCRVEIQKCFTKPDNSDIKGCFRGITTPFWGGRHLTTPRFQRQLPTPKKSRAQPHRHAILAPRFWPPSDPLRTHG